MARASRPLGIYMNAYKCHGWKVEDIYVSPIVGSPLSPFGDGWTNVNGGSTSGTGITINSNGTLKID